MLVRHGETVGQSSIRLYGATDIELSAEGEAQVAATGRALAGGRFDTVFCSCLVRARRSADIVLDTMGHPSIAVEVVDDFREVDFGAWEGWTWAEVRERDPEGHARWQRDGDGFCYPGGEARRSFVARVQAACAASIEARFAAGSQRQLVVVHRGVIRAIAARLLGCGFDELEQLATPLGGPVYLRSDGGWRLESAP